MSREYVSEDYRNHKINITTAEAKKFVIYDPKRGWTQYKITIMSIKDKADGLVWDCSMYTNPMMTKDILLSLAKSKIDNLIQDLDGNTTADYIKIPCEICSSTTNKVKFYQSEQSADNIEFRYFCADCVPDLNKAIKAKYLRKGIRAKRSMLWTKV